MQLMHSSFPSRMQQQLSCNDPRDTKSLPCTRIPELNDIKKRCIIHESGSLFIITVISVGTIRYHQLSAHLNFAGSREFLFTKSLDSNMS